MGTRTTVVLALCATAVVSAGARGSAETSKASQPVAARAAEPTTSKTVVIPVEGMSCMACVARVKKTLGAVAGVTDVHMNLVERNARVRFDSSRVSPERLVQAINGLGYYAGTPAEVR